MASLEFGFFAGQLTRAPRRLLKQGFAGLEKRQFVKENMGVPEKKESTVNLRSLITEWVIMSPVTSANDSEEDFEATCLLGLDAGWREAKSQGGLATHACIHRRVP